MPGTLRIAYKLLVNDRTKYAALLVGITFAVFLMIEMTSLFSGILSRASATVINIGASIWVMDPAVRTVANTIPLPDYVQDEPNSNVLSLQSQLASYEATIPQLEQKVTQSDDLLATLVGQVPAAFAAPDIRLAELRLPGELPVSLPSDLVRQRPDILVAEAAAHAASANIGVATAAMLPSVNLRADYSANSTAVSGLFTPAGRAWNLGAGIAQPLFQGGSLWFKRKAAIDDYQQAAALYRQSVLVAFQQVADTLRALDHDALALRAEDEALQSASDALHLVQTNYTAGLDTYLDVLNADAQFHQAQIANLQAIAVRYQDTVALYVALGGGWWNAPHK